MNKIGNKWNVAASVMAFGSLSCGMASPREVKTAWQRMRGAKSNAKPCVDSHVTLIPAQVGRDEAIRDGLLTGLAKASVRLKDSNKRALKERILAWNDPEGFSDDVDEGGAIRPFTTALGTLRQLPSCAGDTEEYQAALGKLKAFATENSKHIQNGSVNGLRVNNDCPYTAETVKEYMNFLEKGCELMDEVVRLAVAQS